MNNVVINRGFIIRGYYVPPFEVKPGKLIRIYIPNFSVTNEQLGFDLVVELVNLFSKKKAVTGLNILESIPYAKNFQQSFWERNISIKTAKRYLIKIFSASVCKADNILVELGVNAAERLDELKLSKRKLLTIKGLLISNEIIVFDYYGVSADSIDVMNNIIKQELDNGKSFVGFDNLQYIEEKEPYDGFERVVIEFTGEV